MKRINIYLVAMLSVFAVSSCGLSELDNYDGPNATIYGSIFDEADGSLLQQDLQGGVGIEYVEHYRDDDPNPPKQSLVVKQDGNYRYTQLFANTYDYFLPKNGNFVQPDTLKNYVIKKGDNKLDWTVTPYARLKDVNIVDDKVARKIVATFRVEKDPAVASKNLQRVGLYVHMTQGVCGNPNTIYRIEQDINNVSPDPATVYTLEMTYGPNAGHDRLKNNVQYFFRVGARVDFNADAKYNYWPEKRMPLAW